MSNEHPTATGFGGSNPLDRRFLLGGLAGAAGITALTAMARGGPLNPPAGSITGTGKTLTDVEPRIAINATNTPGSFGYTYTITANGSYYLTSDLVTTGGNGGIFVVANRVTIDLNGFSIVCGGSGVLGIFINSLGSVLAFRNGSLIGWNDAGIAPTTSAPSITICEDLRFKNCVRGVQMPGPIFINRCIAKSCAITGIETSSPDSVVNNCIAESCGTGFYLNPYCVAQACSASACTTGFFGNDGSRISDCSATGCTALGFDLGSAVLLKDCVARANGTSIAAGNANIRAGVRANIVNCTAEGGPGRGIQTSHSALISGCIATGNGSNGIEVGDGTLVERCNVSSNGGHGIVLAAYGRVNGCVVDYHQAAGTACVKCTGANNTVEFNQFSRAPVGVDMNGVSGNVVLSNRITNCPSAVAVSGGGNWYPNIAVSGVNTATNPVANIIY